jgi:hypothetical protein
MLTTRSTTPAAAKAQLIACSPEALTALYPVALPFLERSYRRARQEVPVELYGELKRATRVLWLLVRDDAIIGAGITSLWNMRDGRVCKMEHCGGGTLKLWLPLGRVIEQYARAEGCVRVLAEARPGWARYAPDYKAVAIVLEKRL